MTMIQKLIAHARGDDPEAAAQAADALVALGGEGGVAVIAAIESDEGHTRSPLIDVLLAMEDRQLVPQLCELIESPHVDLSIAAFQLLGQLGDERAVPPLVRALNDDIAASSVYLAARALGHLGCAEAVEPLLQTATEHLGDWADPGAAVDRLLAEVARDWCVDPLMVLPDVATALARLGRQDLGDVMVRLTAFDPSIDLDDLDDIHIARHWATQALCHVTAPGTISALQKAAREGDPETRQAALEALFYLGLPESVGTLLNYLDDESHAVGHSAMVWFNRITGQSYEPGETSPESPRLWWKKQASRFGAGVCHRRGAPITVQAIVEEMAEQPNAAPDLVRELYIISGRDLRRDRHGENRAADWPTLTQRWLAGEGAPRLEAGRIYKYGVLRKL